jgi:hypothetical protein
MINYYVATDGLDTNAGDIDHPFLTLGKARDIIRTLQPLTDSVTVWIRAGEYQLTASFALTSADCGTADHPILYTNYGAEEVHIIGGQKLDPTHWVLSSVGHDAIYDRLRAPAQAAVYQIDMTAESPTITSYGSLATRPMQLFFDGSPMTLARYPNKNATPGITTKIGDYTTQFDISNPSSDGVTWRYTYDGTGTDPVINATTVPVGTMIYVNLVGGTPVCNILNRDSFSVTASGDNYFEVNNPVGVAETNKTIGTLGYLQLKTQWLRSATGTSGTHYGFATTAFTISNTTGTTWRYTWVGGTTPTINSTTMPNGSIVVINGQNFKSANNGTFVTTGVNNAGWFEVTNALGEIDTSVTIGTGYIHTQDKITYKFTDRDWMSNCTSPSFDAYLYGSYRYLYLGTFQQINNIVTATKTINLTDETPMGTHQYGYEGGNPYCIVNVPEELDSAGEYYIDRSTGILYFWAPGDVDPDTKDSYVSLLDDPLVTMTDVTYTTLHGLIFEYNRGQAILAHTCDHVVIDASTIRNIGGRRHFVFATAIENNLKFAIAIDDSTNCGITNSFVYNCADGAIYMQGGNRASDPQIHSHNYITGNTIHDNNIWNMQPATVTLNGLGYEGYNYVGIGDTFSHNVVYNQPFIGLWPGGIDHIIEYNEFYNVCTDQSDTGAIDAANDDHCQGNIIRFNIFRDMKDIFSGGVYGVYLDQTIPNYTVYGNIFKNLPQGILMNSGSNHVIANNLFINNTIRGLSLTATYGPTGCQFLCNVNYCPTTYKSLMTVTGQTKKNNWYRDAPGFTDFAGGDYSFAITSPLWSFGWQAIPISDITVSSVVTGPDWAFNLPNLVWTGRQLKASLNTGLLRRLPLDSIGQDVTPDLAGDAILHDHTNGGTSWLGSTEGKAGSGLHLDGNIANSVTITSNTALTTHGARTFSFWLNPTAGASATIFDFGGIGFGIKTLKATATYRVTFYLLGTLYKQWVDVRTLEGGTLDAYDGNWHHWCITIDYINGVFDLENAVLKIDNHIVSKYSSSIVGSPTAWTGLLIGRSTSDSTNFSIDEVMVWDRVLSDAEITDLYDLDIFDNNNVILFMMDF